MKLEPLIKTNATRHQSRTTNSNQYPANQGAAPLSLLVSLNSSERERPVGHLADQPLAAVPGEASIDESPGGLQRSTASIADNAEYIKQLQSLDDLADKQQIIDLDIIMNENNTLFTARVSERRVVNRREALCIREAGKQVLAVEPHPLQGLSQR